MGVQPAGSSPRTSPEHPWPVRTVAAKISSWIGRLGQVWVEGQVTGYAPRGRQPTVFFTLRDPSVAMSLSVTASRPVVDRLDPPLADGARVVLLGQPDFYPARGTLSLRALDIRPVGVGDLLARVERLRVLLAAEGLFGAERKVALPFLPRLVGLVCGRESAAERDVVENAARRWPAVRFRVEEVAVQGPYAVTEVVDALRRLDQDPAVDVVVLARGGGSVEDLLPFSDESLVRAVAAMRTPVVSAIGHEQDMPLVDLAADVRASTPTDAGKRVVPDVAEELARIRRLREGARATVARRLQHEQDRLTALRSRPVLASPLGAVARRQDEVTSLVGRARWCLRERLGHAETDVAHARARVTALSPAATLARGYAVVLTSTGRVVRGSAEVSAGDAVSIRLGRGSLRASVTGSDDG